MSFAKVKKQTLPEMIENFKHDFNEYKSSLENNPGWTPDPSSIHQITLKIQSFDFQMNRMEKELSNASDTEAIEYSDKLNNLRSQYTDFKKRWQPVAEMISDESNSNNTNNNRQLMVDQSVVDQETDELEYLARQTEEISRTSKEINEIGNSTLKELNDQRVKIIKIDKITTDTVPIMEKGNKQLEKAEENQKSSCTIY